MAESYIIFVLVLRRSKPACILGCFIWLFSLLISAPRINGQSQHVAADGAAPLEFSVVSIKPASPRNDDWQLEFNVDGFVAQGVTLRDVVKEAYGIYQNDRILGGPDWFPERKFDIEAKVDSDNFGRLKQLTLDERRAMLIGMLASRAHFSAHEESVPLAVYGLVKAKGGPKFQTSDAKTLHPGGIQGIEGLVRKSGPGFLDVEGFSMAAFSRSLSFILGRTVVDQTGLTGRYDLSLRWDPTNGSVDTRSENQYKQWPDLFAALDEQLGLRLERARLPVTVVRIDSLEIPSAN